MSLKPVDKLLVVISYFEARPADHLYSLLDSLHSTTAGIEYDICLVINQAHQEQPVIHNKGVKYLHRRENTGMNIGAWDYGWRKHGNYRDYLFLQDECLVTGHDWGRKFTETLELEDIGLVGESINKRWDKPWDSLKMKRRTRPDHPMGDTPFYLDFMTRHGIDPGLTGRHARALVWALHRSTLELLDGFPIGTTYRECIAAEIAVSRKIESLGLKVVQIDSKSFSFIQHAEWSGHRKKAAGPTGTITHWKRLLSCFGWRNKPR